MKLNEAMRKIAPKVEEFARDAARSGLADAGLDDSARRELVAELLRKRLVHELDKLIEPDAALAEAISDIAIRAGSRLVTVLCLAWADQAIKKLQEG